MKWKTIPLGEIAEFRNGLNYTKEDEGSGLLVINVKDFGDKLYPEYSELGEISEMTVTNEEALLKTGDILFVRSNGNKDLIGRSIYIDNPPDNLSFSAFCIRARLTDKVLAKFYLYYFRSPLFRKKLALLGRGVNISNLNQQVLKQISVPLPSRKEQERVVELISSYDDLIENNRRRIDLLEQSARMLYKEWFVSLRFPGHEHVKVKDGVPQGWKKESFSKLAYFMNGYAFEPSDWETIGFPIVKIPELRSGVLEKTPRNNGNNIPEKYFIDTGDILFSWSGTLLVNIWNHGRAILNQHLFKVIPASPNMRNFVYIALQLAVETFHNETVGATMKHIRRSALDRVQILIPSSILIEQFEEICSPLLSQISTLQKQINQLQQARDLLLPRLMNGEIPV